MNKRTLISVLVFSIGLLLWIVYFLEEELASYGIYTVIGYGLYKVMILIPLILPCCTIGWLIILIVWSKKEKNFKENGIVILFLVLATFFQMNYVVNMMNSSSTSTIAYIDSIDKEERIVIRYPDSSESVLHQSLIF